MSTLALVVAFSPDSEVEISTPKPTALFSVEGLLHQLYCSNKANNCFRLSSKFQCGYSGKIGEIGEPATLQPQGAVP